MTIPQRAGAPPPMPRTVTTEPLLTSRADAFTVRVTPNDGEIPEGFGALVIDPGTSAADAQVGATAQAAAAAPSVDFPYPAPKIISRAGWGADESLRTADPECVTPDYDNTIKIGFVHHTASTNNYTATTAFEQLRAIYAYHIQGFGWCDFGYNFLVDKYGRIFEGRWGGVDRPVHGAHTGGFNTDTFAVSALGNYEEVGAPDGMVNSIAQVLGWKLGMYARDVYGRDTLVSAGGGTSRYPAGVSVTFNVISGHRDPGNTLCPGQFLYDRLPQIRQIAAGVAQQTYTGITAVNPVNQRKSYAGSAASISAFVPASTYYEFTVTELCTGRTVRRFIGFTERGTLQLGWDLRDDSGQYVRGGNYSWRLAATNGGQATGQVEVVPPTERAAGATTASGISAAGFIPITPVRVSDSRNGNAQPLAAASTRNIKVVGAGQVPATGVQGVALNVTSVCATEQTFFTAWAAGSPQPFTSSLNVGPGDVVPGLVVAPVGADGSVTVYNSNGSSHLVVDVVGYFPADRWQHPAQHHPGSGPRRLGHPDVRRSVEDPLPGPVPRRAAGVARRGGRERDHRRGIRAGVCGAQSGDAALDRDVLGERTRRRGGGQPGADRHRERPADRPVPGRHGGGHRRRRRVLHRPGVRCQVHLGHADPDRRLPHGHRGFRTSRCELDHQCPGHRRRPDPRLRGVGDGDADQRRRHPDHLLHGLGRRPTPAVHE